MTTVLDTAVHTTTDGVLQERARIARELHDSVLQTLYTIALAASRGLRLSPSEQANEVQNVLRDLKQLASDGQSELRALLTDTRSDPPAAHGLTVGLAALGADLRARNGLDIGLSLADEPDVPVTTKQALVSIGREALHNAVKHASATRVDIVLEVHADQLVLQIADDGRGFDPRGRERGTLDCNRCVSAPRLSAARLR